MSLVIRSAKFGSDWTLNELDAYNVVIRNQYARTFQDLPAMLEGVDPDFVNATGPSEAANANTHHLLIYLDLATRANAGQESAIDNFAKELLRLRSGVTPYPYVFVESPLGRLKSTYVCLVHHASTVLVQDKTELSAKDPAPQVVAAFQMNNPTGVDLVWTGRPPCRFPASRYILFRSLAKNLWSEFLAE